MELKLVIRLGKNTSYGSSNRTFMELKLVIRLGKNTSYGSSNRTFMELKCHNHVEPLLADRF